MQTKAMLIGGLVTGMLSALPKFSSGNCICFMWVIIGGCVASYFLLQSAKTLPSDGEGALAGLGSGIIGAIVSGIIQYIFLGKHGADPSIQRDLEQLVINLEGLTPENRDALLQFVKLIPFTSQVFSLVVLLLQMAIYAGMGSLGGFLGIRYFRQRRLVRNQIHGWRQPIHGVGGPTYNSAGNLSQTTMSGPSPSAASSPDANYTAQSNADYYYYEQRVMHWLVVQFWNETGIDISNDTVAVKRLRDALVNAFKELSTVNETVIALPFLSTDASGPRHFNIKISRDVLASITDDVPPIVEDP